MTDVSDTTPHEGRGGASVTLTADRSIGHDLRKSHIRRDSADASVAARPSAG
jgi:hypothetical protein